MLIYGSGGHAKVVLDCIKANKKFIDGIFDDYSEEKEFQKYPVLGKYDPSNLLDIPLVIAVGDNKIRKQISEIITHKFKEVIHPSAQVSEYASIDEGTVIFHNSVVQAGSKIGKHCILNTGVCIDHDNEIENFAHISPNATLSGTVKVGEGSWIGSGAVIKNNTNIGKWCVIGAGAVVINDVPDYSVVVGNPGKIIKKVNEQ